MAMTYPFQGVIYYEVEASYKAGFSGTQLRISDAVQNVRIETGDINTELMTISEASIADFSKTMEDPTLHIEWVLQPNASGSMVSECVERINGELNSMAIEVGTNTSRASNAFYYMIGCRCKSVTVSASKGENWIISADFSVASLQVSDTATGSDPVAIGTAYAAFNVAGGITWGGVTGAFVTQSFSFTVDNNLTDYWDVGELAKKEAIPGAIGITGNCDISLDDGGTVHFNEVLDSTAITSMILNTGLTTGDNGKFTLTNGRFDSTNITCDTSGTGIISSVPFTFKTVVLSTGT